MQAAAAGRAAAAGEALQATQSARSPAALLLEAGFRPARAPPALAGGCAAGPGRKQAVQGLSTAVACMAGV